MWLGSSLLGVVQVGDQRAPAQILDIGDIENIENSPVRCANARTEQLFIDVIDTARRLGDTVGE